jgi:hypothetical protein
LPFFPAGPPGCEPHPRVQTYTINRAPESTQRNSDHVPPAPAVPWAVRRSGDHEPPENEGPSLDRSRDSSTRPDRGLCSLGKTHPKLVEKGE